MSIYTRDYKVNKCFGNKETNGQTTSTPQISVKMPKYFFFFFFRLNYSRGKQYQNKTQHITPSIKKKFLKYIHKSRNFKLLHALLQISIPCDENYCKHGLVIIVDIDIVTALLLKHLTEINTVSINP